MPTRSNVLFLMTDQHRLDTLGCYGNPVCETPALDGLAATGTRFDRCFTPTAICTPARTTLLTGALPFRHGFVDNPELAGASPHGLGSELVPFPRLLASASYNLGHIGKWHIGDSSGPEDHGLSGQHYPGWGNPLTHPDYLGYLAERGLPGPSLRSEVHGTRPNGRPSALLAGVLDQPVEATFEYFLAERTIEMLRTFAAEDRPFYLACNWFGPHLPYCVPESYYLRYPVAEVPLPASTVETFAGKPRVQSHYSEFWTFDSFSEQEWRALIAAYWGYVTLIDEQVGRIVGELEALGLTDDTAVFFTADHGEFTGSHRLHSKGPAMYDDIYRIPLLARVPNAPAPAVDDRFVTLTDLTPTILELAGVDVPPNLDGRSLLPLIRQQPVADWPEEVVTEFHGLHFPYPQRMIRTATHKLVVNPADRNELYDLRTDPDELHNRYDHHELADVRRELTRRLYTTLHDRDDPFRGWMAAMLDVG